MTTLPLIHFEQVIDRGGGLALLIVGLVAAAATFRLF